jgi:hypothetical protein
MFCSRRENALDPPFITKVFECMKKDGGLCSIDPAQGAVITICRLTGRSDSGVINLVVTPDDWPHTSVVAD